MIDLYYYYSQKSIAQLTMALDRFLLLGYIDENSFEDPNDDAFKCLLSLLKKNLPLYIEYSKKVFENESFPSEYLKASCFESLLVDDYCYAIDFIDDNYHNMSVPILVKVLEFFCYSDNIFLKQYLIKNTKKIQDRFYILRDSPDAEFYHLHEAYNDFLKHAH